MTSFLLPLAADQPNTLDLNPGKLVERLDSWLDGFMRLIPNIAVAVLTVAALWLLGKFIKGLIRKSFGPKRENLGSVLGGFVKWVIIVLAFLLAATIIMPTLKPGDLIAGLGVSSVAIGFAFKDILQNWLAGLLILLRQPFQVGDQIVVNGYEGTVERVETSATLIKTYDGQRVVIPNSDIYTNSVIVRTAFKTSRSQYDIGIGYGDDIDQACEIILQVLDKIEGIETDPQPQALPWSLDASWVTIRARWWSKSPRADIVRIHAEVIKNIKQAFDRASIDMPFETYVQLLHDQTETDDGVRGSQREGWPMTDQPTQPRNPNRPQ